MEGGSPAPRDGGFSPSAAPNLAFPTRCEELLASPRKSWDSPVCALGYCGGRQHRVRFMGKDSEDDILKMVTEIVSAYVSKNPVPASELPAIIRNVHATLGGIGGDDRALPRSPAVPVKKSVQD